jgi:hypothetical protein
MKSEAKDSLKGPKIGFKSDGSIVFVDRPLCSACFLNTSSARELPVTITMKSGASVLQPQRFNSKDTGVKSQNTEEMERIPPSAGHMMRTPDFCLLDTPLLAAG